MARTKSTPGSKSSRANNTKEQTGAGASTSATEIKTVDQTVPAASAPVKAAAETKMAPETRVTSEASAAPEAQSAPKLQASPGPRKMEAVKNEPRKNVVPINLEDEIRRRAYEIYQRRGTGAGSEAEDWFTAERDVRQRYRQQSA